MYKEMMRRDRSEIPPGDPLVYLRPVQGHPSSLWSNFRVTDETVSRPYLLPSDFGFPEDLGERIIQWTDYHRNHYIDDTLALGQERRWKPGADPEKWKREGMEIACEISSLHPEWTVIYTGPCFLVPMSLEGPTPSIAIKNGGPLE